MGRKPDLFHDLFLTLFLCGFYDPATPIDLKNTQKTKLKGAEGSLVFSKGAKFCFLHGGSIQQLVKMIYVLWKSSDAARDTIFYLFH